MSAIVLLLVVVGIVVSVQQLHARRQRWLDGLALSGSWECVVDGRTLFLDLRGGPGSGDYEERYEDGGRPFEQGTWEIRGHDICFRPVAGPSCICQLRAFGNGSIGVHGDARTQRIYQRRVSNVIPLRARNK